MLRQALRRGVAASAASTPSSSWAPSRSSPSAGLSRAFSSSSAEAAAAPGAAAAGNQSPRRARWLLFLPPAAAAFLCHWQLERRHWKVRLLEAREEALKREPMDLEEVLSSLRRNESGAGEGSAAPAPGPPREMTRVVVLGGGGGGADPFSFDPSSTFLVGPRPRSFGGSTVSGSLVVTPLRRREEKGAGALVVRGWVPAGWTEEVVEGGEDGDGDGNGNGDAAAGGKRTRKKREKRPSPRLLCVLRDSESPSRFVPDNDPSKGLWHWIDKGAMAEAAGLSREATPLLEVVSCPSSSDGSFGRGAEEQEDDVIEEEKVEKKPKRPSLMEVLGGRTAERGSGSPLASSSSASSSSPSSSPPPPSSSSSPPLSRPKQKQKAPQPRPLEEVSQVPVYPEQHLQYAATWGTLAAVTAALAVKVGGKGRRGGR